MLEPLARLGDASKAVIYGIVGVFAILAIASRGGLITDTSGALRVVMTQPFGRVLLLVLAVGLCGYAVWRLLDAFADPDGVGTSPTGLVTRIGHAVRGAVYGALGIDAFRLLRGRRGSGSNAAELWTARIFEIPLGEVAVGLAGAIAAAYGVSEIAQGLRAALTSNPDQAAGSRESMLRLGGIFEGRWFLAFIAAGVIAYAIDQAVHARCRRIRPVV